MLRRLFARLGRLFGRRKFGGFDAVSEMKTDLPQDFTDRQY